MREESGKETFLSQTLRSCQNFYESENPCSEDSMQTKSPRRKMVNICTSPIEDGTVILSGRDKVFRISTSIQDHPAQR